MYKPKNIDLDNFQKKTLDKKLLWVALGASLLLNAFLIGGEIAKKNRPYSSENPSSYSEPLYQKPPAEEYLIITPKKQMWV
jgi:hypothetical protein